MSPGLAIAAATAQNPRTCPNGHYLCWHSQGDGSWTQECMTCHLVTRYLPPKHTKIRRFLRAWVEWAEFHGGWAPRFIKIAKVKEENK